MFEDDRRRTDEIEFFRRIVEHQAGTVLPRQKMPDELFELFAAYGLDAVRLALVRKLRIDVIDRGIGRSHHDGGGKHALAGQARAVELILDIPLDLLCLLFVGIDIGDEFAVKIEQAEGKAHHLFLAGFRKIADLDALSAEVDENWPLARLVVDVCHIVAVGLRLAVDQVDGQPRFPEHGLCDLVKVLHMAQSCRCNEIAPLDAELRARILEAREHFDQLFRSAFGQPARLEIMHQAQRSALLEHDLRLFRLGRRNDHGNAARADIDDTIFHNFFS